MHANNGHILNSTRPAPTRRWAIILAGGEGTRLSPFIRRWLGSHRPKQYCAFTGKKTMLEHALERAAHLVPEERILTVIGTGHRRFLKGNGGGFVRGRILEQPANRDTAPGVFLPLAHIMAADPEATVLIFPSDHYISPAGTFLDTMRRAADSAELSDGRVVLLGAVPDSPETEYGWVEATPGKSGEATAVTAFREKPDANEAATLFQRGHLWNTMIMAAKARSLWELGRLCLPDMVRGFEALQRAFGTPGETMALSVVYGCMKPSNFSRDILESRPARAAVIPMEGVEWSDWGRPARIRETLERKSLKPAFPTAFADGMMTARACL